MVQEDTASQAGSEDEERDHDETFQLLSKKLQLMYLILLYLMQRLERQIE